MVATCMESFERILSSQVSDLAVRDACAFMCVCEVVVSSYGKSMEKQSKPSLYLPL